MNDKKKVFRHELKYYIDWHEYTYLKERLKTTLVLDKNVTDDIGYNIRSLYFDDMYNTAYREKESGILERYKYRIRIYEKNDTVIKLEKKRKIGEMTAKESATLTRQEYDSILKEEYDFLIFSDMDLKRGFYVELRTKLLKPVVIVDYDREAYTLEAGNVRVTFDKHLRAGINSIDIFDENIVTQQILTEPLLILEIKYDEFIPSYVKNILQLRGRSPLSISKYVLCRKNNIDLYGR